MPIRCLPLFTLLLLIAAPAVAQKNAELEHFLTRKYPPTPAPQNIEPTGETFGEVEIMRGVVNNRIVEFARGEIIVAVNNVDEGSDPTAYISPIVEHYGLIYVKEFAPQLSGLPSPPRRAVLGAPDDELFARALEALQEMPLVRLAAVHGISRLN